MKVTMALIEPASSSVNVHSCNTDRGRQTAESGLNDGAGQLITQERDISSELVQGAIIDYWHHSYRCW